MEIKQSASVKVLEIRDGYVVLEGSTDQVKMEPVAVAEGDSLEITLRDPQFVVSE